MIATINKVWYDLSEHTHIHIYSPSVTHAPSKVGWYLRAILQPPFSPYAVNARWHHCSLVLFRLVNEHLVTGGGQAKALCVGSGKAGLDWWEHGRRRGFRGVSLRLTHWSLDNQDDGRFVRVRARGYKWKMKPRRVSGLLHWFDECFTCPVKSTSQVGFYLSWLTLLRARWGHRKCLCSHVADTHTMNHSKFENTKSHLSNEDG